MQNQDERQIEASLYSARTPVNEMVVLAGFCLSTCHKPGSDPGKDTELYLQLLTSEPSSSTGKKQEGQQKVLTMDRGSRNDLLLSYISNRLCNFYYERVILIS
ncbi:rCG25676 [Rattus norvegicus]|uniref:RCG25676 n=1 Tax=Rattus norvegicus TaxID=10116 RepID=A6I3P3_RAT|nr:rCG25676 [Rattus norvegicus]